ncbi:hypothetical protein [Brevibacillus sp. SYSU BS000544]|uniref:hypothetical protein n=1 Tax=Brevibacillus sp. SYSU BS000544 TaxID=3416443 RepID=UPI003CE4707E
MKLQPLIEAINEASEDQMKQEQAIKDFLYSFIKQGHYFVVSPWPKKIDETGMDLRPYFGLHLDKYPTYYVFTDSKIAYVFAQHYGLCLANGEALTIKMPTENFIERLKHYQEQGVELVMFDEGESYFAHTIPYIVNVLEEIGTKNTKNTWAKYLKKMFT